MSDKSSIEWTDATWNPLRGTIGRHHCVRVSEGCKNCYAATDNHRFKGPDYVKGADTPRLDENALLIPLKWKEPRKIFVCSMTDLFMDEHPDEFIDKVFAVMGRARHHTFQVLTKRSKRMREYCNTLGRHHETDRVSLAAKALWPNGPGFFWTLGGSGWHLPNVWIGVSAENQARADERIPDLLATPAAVRGVSLEPMLGPIRLDRLREYELGTHYNALTGAYEGEGNGPRLDWVIVGGESGGHSRPCEVAWVQSIVQQCQAAGVAPFVKQLGARPLVKASRQAHWEWGGEIGRPDPTFEAGDSELEARGLWRVILRKENSKRDPKGGWMPSWPEDLRVRQFPETRS